MTTRYRILQSYETIREGDWAVFRLGYVRVFSPDRPGQSGFGTKCLEQPTSVAEYILDSDTANLIIRAVRLCSNKAYRWLDVGERIEGGKELMFPKYRTRALADTPLWSAEGDTTTREYIDEVAKNVRRTIDEALRDASGFLHEERIHDYLNDMLDAKQLDGCIITEFNGIYRIQVGIKGEYRMLEEIPQRKTKTKTKTYEPRAGDVIRYRRGSGAASTIRSVADGQVHYTNGGWDFVETFVTDPDVTITRGGKVIKEPADAQQENQKEVDEAVAQQPVADPDARPRVGVSSVPANTSDKAAPDPYEEHRRKLAEPRPGLRSRLDAVIAQLFELAGRDGYPSPSAVMTEATKLREIFLALPSGAPFDDEPPIECIDRSPFEVVKKKLPAIMRGEKITTEGLTDYPYSTIEDPHVEKPKRTDYADNDYDYGDWQGAKDAT